MDYQFYDTYSNSKKIFSPLDPTNVRMYVCGPTVYDYAHVGNARPVIVFDIVYRMLKFKYGEDHVTYVRNITDVDDKIIEASNTLNEDIASLTKRTIEYFHDDAEYVGALTPTYEPKATDHISEMISIIEKLIKKNHAYESDGNVLFAVDTFENYGQLSGKSLEDLIAGSRVEVADYKKNSADFILWKPSKENEPGWDSPWGKGRPGWHIECSAMSEKYLGQMFDIHGGGQDLTFPHHENEIAQSRCANETSTFANYWIHNAFITMSNEKMAKSQGNILKIKNFRKKISGQVLRLALMSAHYKQPLDWNDKLLSECENTLDKWYRVYSNNLKTTKISDEILKPLFDDLNTPGYIANLHQLYEKASKGHDQELFLSACQFVGLLNENYENWQQYKKDKASINETDILNKIELRNKARKNKDYKEADRIRNELLDKGVLIEDKDGKTIWKFK
mgnify:CR=1 FL=1